MVLWPCAQRQAVNHLVVALYQRGPHDHRNGGLWTMSIALHILLFVILGLGAAGLTWYVVDKIGELTDD